MVKLKVCELQMTKVKMAYKYCRKFLSPEQGVRTLKTTDRQTDRQTDGQRRIANVNVSM